MKENKRLSRNYYLNLEGNIDEIYNACSCFEQFEYLNLKIYNINPCFVFCNDISPKYIQKNNYHYVSRNSFPINQEIFISSEINIINNNFFDIIKKTINKGYLIAFSTYFNMLPPYGWYKDIESHSSHYGIIVDYDKNYYYFIDTPNVLEPNRNIKYPKNKQISLIGHDILHEAFNHLCKLVILDINFDKLRKINSTKEILNKIQLNYSNAYIQKGKDEVIYYGKSALDKIKESIFSEDFKYLEKTFFQSHWEAHLILSRHIILKQCIKNEQIMRDSIIYIEILNELNRCIQLWDSLKLIVFKNSIKKMTNYSIKINKIFEKILKQEEAFIELIKNI